MTRPRRALVTGATGAVGPALVAELLRRGWMVRVLTRGGAGELAHYPEIEFCSGDITDSGRIIESVRDVDVVFHLAALLHKTDPMASMSSEYFKVNVEGTRNVIDAASRRAVQRVVVFSTISVYPLLPDGIVDESTPPAPETAYALSKVEAERIALGAVNHAGDPLSVVLRLASVYGCHVKANYRRLLDAVASGRFVRIGSGENRRTLVYEQDVAGAALLAAESTAAAGKVYNVTDGSFHQMRDIIGAIADATGRRAWRLSIPALPVRMALQLSSALLGSRAPFSPSTLEKYLEDVAVSGEKIQRELGFAPAYGLREGWIETVALLKQSRAQGPGPWTDRLD